MVRFEVIEKIGPDVKCRCNDPGILLPRANLTLWRNHRLVQERNAMLPTISSKVGAFYYLDVDDFETSKIQMLVKALWICNQEFKSNFV